MLIGALVGFVIGYGAMPLFREAEQRDAKNLTENPSTEFDRGYHSGITKYGKNVYIKPGHIPPYISLSACGAAIGFFYFFAKTLRQGY